MFVSHDAKEAAARVTTTLLHVDAGSKVNYLDTHVLNWWPTCAASSVDR